VLDGAPLLPATTHTVDTQPGDTGVYLFQCDIQVSGCPTHPAQPMTSLRILAKVSPAINFASEDHSAPHLNLHQPTTPVTIYTGPPNSCDACMTAGSSIQSPRSLISTHRSTMLRGHCTSACSHVIKR